jgi:hypothetical protein
METQEIKTKDRYTHKIVIQENEFLGIKELTDNSGVAKFYERFELENIQGEKFGTLTLQSSGRYVISMEKSIGAFKLELSRQDVNISRL